MTTAPAAPTCSDCGIAPLYASLPHTKPGDCIRALATRLTEAETLLRGYNTVNKALAERVKALEERTAGFSTDGGTSMRLTSQPEPEPAEPVRYETVGEINLREQAKNDNESKGWRMGAPVPTVEAPRCKRCEHGPDFHDGAPCCFHSRQGTCGCPEYIAPAANAEPEWSVWDQWQQDDLDMIDEPGPTVKPFVSWDQLVDTASKASSAALRGQPISPRPEGQGAVSHGDDRVDHDTVEASAEWLAEYCVPRDGLSAEVRIEMAAQWAVLLRYISERRSASASSIGIVLRQDDEIESLRAELAALKQPASAPVETAPVATEMSADWNRGRDAMVVKSIQLIKRALDGDGTVDLVFPRGLGVVLQDVRERCAAPAQADGTGNRERAHAIAQMACVCNNVNDPTLHSLTCTELSKALDAAEQRGRASRDGVMEQDEAVEAWRELDAGIIGRLDVLQTLETIARDRDETAVSFGVDGMGKTWGKRADAHRIAARALASLGGGR